MAERQRVSDFHSATERSRSAVAPSLDPGDLRLPSALAAANLRERVQRLGLGFDLDEPRLGVDDTVWFHRIRGQTGYIALIYLDDERPQARRERWYLSWLCVRICKNSQNMGLGKPILVILARTSSVFEHWRDEADDCRAVGVIQDIKFCKVGAIDEWIEREDALASLNEWTEPFRRRGNPTPADFRVDGFDAKPSPGSTAVEQLAVEPHGSAPTGPTVFISYAHDDREWYAELYKFLTPLARKYPNAFWSDQAIEAGTDWLQKITTALESAKIVVALVSKAFLASPFINSNELSQALQAAREKRKTLLWVYVGRCQYDVAELDRWQAAHDVKTPINELKDPIDRDKQLDRVATEVKRLLQAIYGS